MSVRDGKYGACTPAPSPVFACCIPNVTPMSMNSLFRFAICPCFLALLAASATAVDEVARQEEVVARSQKLLGPEDPQTLIAMNELAQRYDAAGRAEDALKLLEQVLTLRRKVSGPEDPETLPGG